jgi:hypothetical protein
MITKKRVDFGGAMPYSICSIVLDLENEDIHFYIAEGDAMKEVDYQEFISEFHSQAHMCILKDDLRQRYIDFNNKIDIFVNEYFGLMGC